MWGLTHLKIRWLASSVIGVYRTLPHCTARSVTSNNTHFSGSSLNITALMLHEVEMDQDRHFKLALNITKNTLKNDAVQRLLNDPLETFDIVVAEWMFNDIYCGYLLILNYLQLLASKINEKFMVLKSNPIKI